MLAGVLSAQLPLNYWPTRMRAKRPRLKRRTWASNDGRPCARPSRSQCCYLRREHRSNRPL